MEAPGTKVMAIDHHFQTSMENCACNRAKSCTQENNAYRMNNSRGNETEGGKILCSYSLIRNENHLPRPITLCLVKNNIIWTKGNLIYILSTYVSLKVNKNYHFHKYSFVEDHIHFSNNNKFTKLKKREYYIILQRIFFSFSFVYPKHDHSDLFNHKIRNPRPDRAFPAASQSAPIV